MQSLSDELRAAPQPRLTEMDKARLRQTAAAEANRLAKGDGRWARWLTAAAAAVFLVSVSQIYLTHQESGDGGRQVPVSHTRPAEEDPSQSPGKRPTAPSEHQPVGNEANPGT